MGNLSTFYHQNKKSSHHVEIKMIVNEDQEEGSSKIGLADQPINDCHVILKKPVAITEAKSKKDPVEEPIEGTITEPIEITDEDIEEGSVPTDSPNIIDINIEDQELKNNLHSNLCSVPITTESTPSIRNHPHVPNEGDEQLPICTICQENEIKKLICLPNCPHVFHQECLIKWQKYNKTCPLCRASINFVTNSQPAHSNIHSSMRSIFSPVGPPPFRPYSSSVNRHSFYQTAQNNYYRMDDIRMIYFQNKNIRRSSVFDTKISNNNLGFHHRHS